MIRFNHVTKRFSNGHDALMDVTFSLNSGEMVFLTGHSGAGKSTLLKLISLLEKPSSGTILLQGKNLVRIKQNAIPYIRQQIGLIFQNPYLLFDRSLLENVAVPLSIRGYHQSEITRRAHAALDQVGLLHKASYYPETLSCGEQQRVNIARAIVTKPPLILADEPTGNLDPDLSLEIMRLFERFNQVGVTILIATHALSVVSLLKHRIINLKNGRLVPSDSSGDSIRG